MGGLQELTEDLLCTECLLRACCFVAFCDHEHRPSCPPCNAISSPLGGTLSWGPYGSEEGCWGRGHASGTRWDQGLLASTGTLESGRGGGAPPGVPLPGHHFNDL